METPPSTTTMLRDGTPITIRPVRPEDKPAIAAGLERLSEQSRYRRFLTPKPRFSSVELTYLTEIDHHSHEGLVAFLPDSREPLGVARFIRLPDEPEVAEPAIAVVDDWQGRGVGTVLLEALLRRAREEGVSRFRATVLSENRPMFALLEKAGRITIRPVEGTQSEVEFQLEPETRWRYVLAALRAAARGELHFERPRRRGGTGDG